MTVGVLPRVLVRTALLWFCLVVLGPTDAFAQSASADPEWAETVARVQRVLDAGRADNEYLVDLRADLAEWRRVFLEAESANAATIDLLNRRLAALGPEPDTEAGESEPSDIAERRQALNDELQEARAPGVEAADAYAEADGLVRQIDQMLRDRQARELLERGPLPINPLNWTPVLNDLHKLGETITAETVAALAKLSGTRDLLFRLPVSLAMVVLAYFLIRRTSKWTEHLEDRVASYSSNLHRVLALLRVDILQLGLPYIGIVLFALGLRFLRLTGSTGNALLIAVPFAAFNLVLGAFIVNRVFPRRIVGPTQVPLADSQREVARWAGHSLVASLALWQLIVAFIEPLGAQQLSLDYIGFVASVPPALFLFWLGVSLTRRPPPEPDQDSANQLAQRAVRALGRAAQLASIAGLASGFAGYFAMSRGIVIPAIYTLGAVFFGVLLQNIFMNIYAVLAKRGDVELAGRSMVPTLFGGVLVVIAIPILALVWGARWTDITEVWTRVSDGFVFGDTRISPEVFGVLLLVFLVGYALTRLVQAVMRTAVLPKTSLDQGAQSAVVSGIGYVGIGLAVLFSVTTAGLNLSSLAIVAGALSVGIGFGLQTIVSNFVSGIILLIERPISEGDWVEVGTTMGHVRAISVRATRIETFDRTNVIVPNSDLISGTVINWTRGNSFGRVIVPVGVAYGTDTRKVEHLLREIANSHPMVTISPEPAILFMAFGASSLDFEIRAIIRDVNFKLGVQSDLNHEIARRFAEEGIEIPFPQNEIWLRGSGTKNAGLRATGDEEQEVSWPTPKVPPDPTVGGDDGGEAR